MTSCNKGLLPAPCLVYGKRPIFLLESMVKIMVSHRGILCRKNNSWAHRWSYTMPMFFMFFFYNKWRLNHYGYDTLPKMEKNVPRSMAQQYVKMLSMVSPCLRWFMVLFSTPNEFGTNQWTFKRFSEKFWNKWRKGPDWQHSLCVIFQFILYIYMPLSNNCMHTA